MDTLLKNYCNIEKYCIVGEKVASVTFMELCRGESSLGCGSSFYKLNSFNLK